MLHVGRELLHRVEEVLLAVGAKLEAAAAPERACDLRGELVAYDAAVRRVVPRHGEVQKYALQAARGKQAQQNPRVGGNQRNVLQPLADR